MGHYMRCSRLTAGQAAAINTVSGVNMTTRRQMLKIKVSPHCPRVINLCRHILQGMSEAKVEKIKVGHQRSGNCA